jgi:hypothetical protein
MFDKTVVKPDLFPSGVAKSVLTLFLVECTSALDRVKIEITPRQSFLSCAVRPLRPHS